MRIRLWEVVIGLICLLLGGLFLYGGAYPLGLVALATGLVWIGARLRVREPGHIAGAFSKRRGWLEWGRCAVFGLIYIGAWAALAVAQVDHWAKTMPGQVAVYSIAGFCFLLLRELNRSADSAMNYVNGGLMEEAVGEALEPLKDEGWTVIHNWLRDDRRANIDHVVWGASGTYAIETKSGKLRCNDLGQAAGNAAWLKEKLDVKWVTAVVCIPGSTEPYEDGVVWVVGRDRLAGWLRSRRARQGFTPVLVPAFA